MDVDDGPSGGCAPSQQKAKVLRRKIFEVNTKKASAIQELEKYLNPINQFEEMTSLRTRRGATSVYRYFFYTPDPVNGPSQKSIELTNDIQMDGILHTMRDIGVDSQSEFDQLAEMLESKVNISGDSSSSFRLEERVLSEVPSEALSQRSWPHP